MQTVLPGGSLTLTGYFYNAPGGVLTNPTSVQLQVYRNSDDTSVVGPLTFAAAQITRLSTGTYQYVWNVPTTAATGTYTAFWTTVTAGATSTSTEVFQVAVGLVSLNDVTAHLNLLASDTSNNAKLQGYIDAATEVIQDLVGAIAPTTYTEYFDGGVGMVVLSHRPVLTIVSAQEVSGTSTFNLTEQPLGGVQDGFGLTVDYSSGQLTRRIMGGGAGMFPLGEKNIWVTYVAGRNTVPANIRLGALELIRHLWQQGQQGNRPVYGDGTGDEGTVSAGFAVPNRVLELIKPHRRTPGVG